MEMTGSDGQFYCNGLKFYSHSHANTFRFSIYLQRSGRSSTTKQLYGNGCKVRNALSKTTNVGDISSNTKNCAIVSFRQRIAELISNRIPYSE